MKIFKRVCSFVLVFVLLASVVLPGHSFAAGESRPSSSVQGVMYDTSAKAYWDSVFSSWFSNLADTWASKVVQSAFVSFCWNVFDSAIVRYGSFSSLSSLSSEAGNIRNRMKQGVFSTKNQIGLVGPERQSFSEWLWSQFLTSIFGGDVECEQFVGEGWFISDGRGNKLCRSNGAVCYFVEPEQAEGETAATLGGKWVDAAFRGGVPGLHLYSYRSTLETVADRLCDLGETCGVQSWTYKNEKYWYILKERGSSVYADKQGRPYVVRQSSDYAVDKNQNYYAPGKDSGDTFNQQLVDLLTGVLNAPRGDSVTQGDNSLYLEDGAIYNPDNRTYSFTATNSFNTTNNYYYTYNYHYEYHINYTSVTYIGTTAEYDQIYEYYYELPDGRSSADLTAAELLALNTEVDVVPYTRSTDNTALRSLYHLDGNVKDSSYWNYLTSWEWVKGASITYMESPSPFGGYLYLDETEHEWNLNLPSGLGSQDFTLQFRLYQKATVTPQADSYIAFGTNQVLKFDGGDFTFNGTAHLMPVGTWNEFAIIRDSGTLRLYLNGVQVDSYTNTAAFSKVITFHFGSQQQTTKGLDELRVLNYALQKGGFAYDPATAPFDTNLALVLPDSSTPVADEYWKFDTTIEPIATWDFTRLSIVSRTDWLPVKDGPAVPTSGTGLSVSSDVTFSSLTSTSSWSLEQKTKSSPFSNGYSFRNPGASELDRYIYWDGSDTRTGSYPKAPAPSPPNGLGFTLAAWGTSYDDIVFYSNYYDFATGSPYVFSLLLADGTICSMPFVFRSASGGNGSFYYVCAESTFDWGEIRFLLHGSNGNYQSPYIVSGIFVTVNEGQTLDIVYAEIVPGSTPNTGHEFISAVAPVNTDFKTPTLAVRTDQTITGYQIGGVRPSLPERGLVYALVENSRITSLQIYNGSMWEKVDGRIWTGSRWVPYYAYDILLFKDLWDIVEADPSQDYIYTESGFWSWLQKAWQQMIQKLDQIIVLLGGSGPGSGSDCQHVYTSRIDREPDCTTPGYKTYTCNLCGHSYTESIDALGHDWVTTGTVEDVLDEEGNVVEKGYEEKTCSRCGAESKDYGDGPEEEDVFDALGDLISGFVSWILDKLTALTESLTGITDIFRRFADRVKELAGEYPAFFGAGFALLPEDFRDIIWFGIVAAVIIAVWRKFTK